MVIEKPLCENTILRTDVFPVLFGFLESHGVSVFEAVKGSDGDIS